MKLLKLIRYDFGYNRSANRLRWLLTAALFSLLFLAFSLDVLHWWWFDPAVGRSLANINVVGLSFGDVVMTEMGGELPMALTSLEDTYLFPIKWFLPHILILYFTLNYAKNDLVHGGIQVLTRVKNRQLWWISKCIWNIVTVVSCFALGVATLFAWTAATGKELLFKLNPDLFSCVMREALPGQTATAGTYFLALCVMPCVVCVAVSLLQMCLSLVVKPVYAYTTACIYYIAGAYYAHPLFISNYSMGVRSAAVGFYNFYPSIGLITCLVLSLTAILAGAVFLERMDLH